MDAVFATNLRALRLQKGMTQEQVAEKLGVSAQSVSRWETRVTFPDVMMLPAISALYGVLVDDLFKPSPCGYENHAQRLAAMFEQTGKKEDFMAAALEFEKRIATQTATADDWRVYGLIHEHMVTICREKAIQYYDTAMNMSRKDNQALYYRTKRQKQWMRSRIGQAAECVAEQLAAVKEAPNNKDEWVTLAAAQFNAGKHEDVLKTCRETEERFGDDGLLCVYMGDSLRSLKRYEAAFAAWEKAVQLDEKYVDALFSAAFCHEELGQWEKAARVWADIAGRYQAMGRDVDAKWPLEMAEKCRGKISNTDGMD